jgi:hypothetical protein
MAISDNQKIDYLFKKLGLGATKTDTVFNKLAANESIPSPLLIRGDTIWSSSGDIPTVRPTDTTTIVQVRTAIEATEDITATGNRTWKTGITDWIPTEFGSTYLVNVYIHTSGDASGAEIMANKVFTTGSGNNDEWFFDYQSGVLNFIGDNLPDGKSFTGKSVFISGATYIGSKGVASAASASGQQADVSLLQAQIDNILSNIDPAALDSLSEIVESFQSADVATNSALAAQNTAIRSDLSLSVKEINKPVSNVEVDNVTGLIFDADDGFVLTDNSDGTVTVTIDSTLNSTLNSTFKTWHVYDTEEQDTPTDVIAAEADQIDIRAGNNITITPETTTGSKGLTFSSDVSGILDLGITDGTNGQVLLTDGLGNFAFGDNSISVDPIPSAQIFVGNGVTVSYILATAPENVESVDVYVNDVLQRPPIFGIVGNILSFTAIPSFGDDIYIKYRYPNANTASILNNSVENKHLKLTYTSSQYTGNNATTQYTITGGHSVHSVLVIVNGAILSPNLYIVSGTLLTLNVAPVYAAVVDIRYLPI